MAFDPSAQFQQKLVTKTLNNSSLTILAEWGVVAFSVLNKRTSTSNGTVNGGTDIGDLVSEDLSILAGGERNFSATPPFSLVGAVITSPDVNCELEVILLLGSNT